MTAAEVRNAAALLGFNMELSDDEEEARFWTALNMALPTVAQIAPQIRSVVIRHDPQLPDFYQEALEKDYDGEVIIEIPRVAALYFEVAGIGEAEIRCGAVTHHVSWEETRYRAVRMILSDVMGVEGDVSIRFYGKYAYGVRYICGFASLKSPKAERLMPPSEFIRYDVSELCEDFGGFSAQEVIGPTVAPRVRIVSETELEIEAAKGGDYEVFYHHRPSLATPERENAALDIEPSLHHLVPLLVAHYLWMDDEPDKAKQYKANYDEQMALWRLREKPTARPRVVDTKGWV